MGPACQLDILHVAICTFIGGGDFSLWDLKRTLLLDRHGVRAGGEFMGVAGFMGLRALYQRVV